MNILNYILQEDEAHDFSSENMKRIYLWKLKAQEEYEQDKWEVSKDYRKTHQ